MAKKRKEPAPWRAPTAEDNEPHRFTVWFRKAEWAALTAASKETGARIAELVRRAVAAKHPPKREESWVDKKARSAEKFFPEDYKGPKRRT